MTSLAENKPTAQSRNAPPCHSLARDLLEHSARKTKLAKRRAAKANEPTRHTMWEGGPKIKQVLVRSPQHTFVLVNMLTNLVDEKWALRLRGPCHAPHPFACPNNVKTRGNVCGQRIHGSRVNNNHQCNVLRPQRRRVRFKMRAYMHTWTSVYMCICIFAQACLCICVYTHIYMLMNIYMHAPIRMCTLLKACVQLCTTVCKYVHTCTHT